VNVWGVGYRLVDGPPSELRGVRQEPPPLAVAAPALDAAIPLDRITLVAWLLAAVGLALAAAGRLWKAAASEVDSPVP
jgi:hypothetical protein